MSTPHGDYGNLLADEDKVFVCQACGKMSKDRYGDHKISRGWDESCMLYAIELPKARLVLSGDGKRVLELKPEQA